MFQVTIKEDKKFHKLKKILKIFFNYLAYISLSEVSTGEV